MSPQLRIVETGTIRSDNLRYATGDGWSTYWIAKWVQQNGGEFISIDLYTQTAQTFLTHHRLQNFVKLYEGDSRQLLPDIPPPIHLALLDSANDETIIMHEFGLVEAKAHIVVIDDVVLNSNTIVKGKHVVPYAKKQGYGVELVDNMAIVHIR